jgi:hypothetical protein
MAFGAPSVLWRIFGPGPTGPEGSLGARWLFLRALGLIYYSAFFSLLFQVVGLIGPDGILPAGHYLQFVGERLGPVERYWFAPTVFWWSSSAASLKMACWIGMVASLLLTINIWPRAMLAICFVAFLSFIAALQDFSSYQSDGMLLAAGFISFFFAPPGLRPGFGAKSPPSSASLFLLQWLWFHIYFESGIAKLLSGDPQWRHFTAMDEYYQNGPLPTWVGWYAQHLPHAVHAFATGLTLAVELGVVCMFLLPRRFRIICFLIVTPFEFAIILTANYTFLNYLVLALGILLLDDLFLSARWRRVPLLQRAALVAGTPGPHPGLDSVSTLRAGNVQVAMLDAAPLAAEVEPVPANDKPASDLTATPPPDPTGIFRHLKTAVSAAGFWTSAVLLSWIFYAATALLLWMFSPRVPLPVKPVELLQPFRIANRYGLFAVMTRARYEIEFQGSEDGRTWVAYPFRYKPQEPSRAPRIYAPYQPRFDWNLWFASLEGWRENSWVVRTEQLLLVNDQAVLSLFAANPFPQKPPVQMRAIIWQYWFTDWATRQKEGLWWNRRLLGLYAPALQRQPDGSISVTQMPEGVPAPP